MTDRLLITDYWVPQPPASEHDIERLLGLVPFASPPEYLALLRYSNGGEGPLDLPPLWLQLGSIDQVIEFSRWKLPAWRFPGYLFFAGNGAGESIAMRQTERGELDILMIDTLAGPDSAQCIASSFAAFVAAIGK